MKDNIVRKAGFRFRSQPPLALSHSSGSSGTHRCVLEVLYLGFSQWSMLLIVDVVWSKQKAVHSYTTAPTPLQ